MKKLRKKIRKVKNAATGKDPAAPSKKKVQGSEITPMHAQYALTYGMMLGIRVSVH
jgi:hypothetical protein